MMRPLPISIMSVLLVLSGLCLGDDLKPVVTCLYTD
jgi:hypothetical protein